MNGIIKKWNKLSFSAKLNITFACAISLAICIATAIQIGIFVNTTKGETVKHLQQLTDQVLLNFTKSQESIASSIYTRLRTFEIPSLMKQCNEDGENIGELQYGLYQTISSTTEYNYVMLELEDGTRVSTDSSILPEGDAVRRIGEKSGAILDACGENTTGVWTRVGDDVFFISDVYDIDPLSLVGKMVIHIRNEPFRISDSYSDMTFRFYNDSGEYLTCAGKDIETENTDVYITANARNDKWTIVGMTSMQGLQERKKSIAAETLLCGLLGITLGVLFQQLLTKSTMKKLAELKEAMNRVAHGELECQMAVRGEDDISQLALTFNAMTGRISGLMKEVLRKEKAEQDAKYEMVEYKYRSMETQIKSHFIYNALENVNALAKLEHNDVIVETIGLISRYFRSIAENATEQYITVEKEFETLSGYTRIYSLTHRNMLMTHFYLPDDVRQAKIPTMILQPIVENALKHAKKEHGEELIIKVSAEKREDFLTLTVHDNGTGISSEAVESIARSSTAGRKERERIGLANVKNRLSLLYGADAGVSVFNGENGGAVVEIEVPFRYVDFGNDDLDILSEVNKLS